MRWFRLYSELLHDPKAQRLPPALFKHWINLLCLANEGEPRGLLPREDDIAFALRVRPIDARRIMHQLEEAGLMKRYSDGHWAPHNWDERQRASDDVAARVRRHRAEKSTPIARDSHDTHTPIARESHATRTKVARPHVKPQTPKSATVAESSAIGNGSVTLQVTLPKRSVDTDTDTDTEADHRATVVSASAREDDRTASSLPDQHNPADWKAFYAWRETVEGKKYLAAAYATRLGEPMQFANYRAWVQNHRPPQQEGEAPCQPISSAPSGSAGARTATASASASTPSSRGPASSARTAGGVSQPA